MNIFSRHQTVTGDISPPLEITQHIFYMFLPLKNLQILVSVMLANGCIACQLFTSLEWLPIMASPCFEVAKVYLSHCLWICKYFLNITQLGTSLYVGIDPCQVIYGPMSSVMDPCCYRLKTQKVISLFVSGVDICYKEPGSK